MADGEMSEVTNWHFIPLVKGENFWNFFIIFAPIKRKNHDNQ